MRKVFIDNGEGLGFAKIKDIEIFLPPNDDLWVTNKSHMTRKSNKMSDKTYLRVLNKINELNMSQYESLYEFGIQVPEDIFIVDRKGRIVYSHASNPFNWDPDDILEEHIANIHSNTLVDSKVIATYASVLNSLISDGPFERHVWNISFDNKLSHGPDFPWKDRYDGDIFIRQERQCSIPFQKDRSVLITIRTVINDIDLLNLEEVEVVNENFIKMNDDVLKSKGLFEDRLDIKSHLNRVIKEKKIEKESSPIVE